MRDIKKFFKECDCFFVLTKNGQFPAGRPFGAIMKFKNEYYICTNSKKDVYKQMIKDNHIQLLAIKRNTRNWARITSTVSESTTLSLSEKFFKQCPRLKQIYNNFKNPNFRIFKLKINKFEEYKN